MACFGLPQWLQLDLGTQTSISEIVTHFYDGDSRVYTYYIQVSSDGSSWTTVVSSKTGSSTVTDTFTSVTCRYVQIVVTGNTANTAAHIEQVTIYQTTNPTPTPTQTPTPTPTPSPTGTLTQVPVSSATASSYSGTHTPSQAIDGTPSNSVIIGEHMPVLVFLNGYSLTSAPKQASAKLLPTSMMATQECTLITFKFQAMVQAGLRLYRQKLEAAQ